MWCLRENLFDTCGSAFMLACVRKGFHRGVCEGNVHVGVCVEGSLSQCVKEALHISVCDGAPSF